MEVADIRLITNLYWGQRAVVKGGDDERKWIKVEREVRQGCVLSPDLFSLYSQLVINEMLDMEVVNVGGLSINNIRYADNTVLIVETADKLQRQVDKLDV